MTKQREWLARWDDAVWAFHVARVNGAWPMHEKRSKYTWNTDSALWYYADESRELRVTPFAVALGGTL